MPIPTDLLRDHARFVEARCPDGDTVAADMRAAAAEIERLRETSGCLFAGPGHGDCWNFVGLPGKSIPGQHDGPDDTVDAYGKPNGWCWSCWKSYEIKRLRDEHRAERAKCLSALGREGEALAEIERLRAQVDKHIKTRDGVPVILGETRVWALNQFGDLLVGVVWMVTAGLSSTTPRSAISVRGRWEDSYGRVVGDTMVYLCDCYSTREKAEEATSGHQY